MAHRPGGVFRPDPVTTLTVTIDDTCVACKKGKHPLYRCSKFKVLPHDQMLSVLRANSLCLNCLRPGHFMKECASANCCQKCQKPHHTLLHVDPPPEAHGSTDAPSLAVVPPGTINPVPSHVAHASSRCHQPLLMTCRVLVTAPNGSTT